jgi:hypothetical protein
MINFKRSFCVFNRDDSRVKRSCIVVFARAENELHLRSLYTIYIYCIATNAFLVRERHGVNDSRVNPALVNSSSSTAGHGSHAGTLQQSKP